MAPKIFALLLAHCLQRFVPDMLLMGSELRGKVTRTPYFQICVHEFEVPEAHEATGLVCVDGTLFQIHQQPDMEVNILYCTLPPPKLYQLKPEKERTYPTFNSTVVSLPFSFPGRHIPPFCHDKTQKRSLCNAVAFNLPLM